jgi:hypothetical protein
LEEALRYEHVPVIQYLREQVCVLSAWQVQLTEKFAAQRIERMAPDRVHWNAAIEQKNDRFCWPMTPRSLYLSYLSDVHQEMLEAQKKEVALANALLLQQQAIEQQQGEKSQQQQEGGDSQQQQEPQEPKRLKLLRLVSTETGGTKVEAYCPEEEYEKERAAKLEAEKQGIVSLFREYFPIYLSRLQKNESLAHCKHLKLLFVAAVCYGMISCVFFPFFSFFLFFLNLFVLIVRR